MFHKNSLDSFYKFIIQRKELLNVGQSTVAMWENGTNIPRVLTLVKLSNIFCCDIDDILDDST